MCDDIETRVASALVILCRVVSWIFKHQMTFATVYVRKRALRLGHLSQVLKLRVRNN